MHHTPALLHLNANADPASLHFLARSLLVSGPYLATRSGTLIYRKTIGLTHSFSWLFSRHAQTSSLDFSSLTHIREFVYGEHSPT